MHHEALSYKHYPIHSHHDNMINCMQLRNIRRNEPHHIAIMTCKIYVGIRSFVCRSEALQVAVMTGTPVLEGCNSIAMLPQIYRAIDPDEDPHRSVDIDVHAHDIYRALGRSPEKTVATVIAVKGGEQE
jgi:hypothetical protein